MVAKPPRGRLFCCAVVLPERQLVRCRPEMGHVVGEMEVRQGERGGQRGGTMAVKEKVFSAGSAACMKSDK